ncbi:ankyrin repeat domain-containing protein [Dyella psychrodurans]|uniref:Uncharacterized protein n=1 Tax=Dyella psychrodurans TaxID=1927960 RepID=A0A370XC61_9GAMM|nr:ankyrin repeat domain-containing protein [Dyella psychrodurans]RDS85892.1 hypothetical protein DWU99_01040 [Dyella psychrodurans]
MSRRTSPYIDALSQHPTRRHQRVRDLIARGVDVNDPGAYHIPPLTYAAAVSGVDDDQVMEMLIAAGADVCADSGDEGTALTTAAANGNFKQVAVLLRHGADQRDRALQATVFGDHEPHGAAQVVMLLLDAGAGLDTRTSGWTPLMWAVHSGYPNCVRVLIDRGADVRAVDGEGKSVRAIAQRCRTDDARQDVLALVLPAIAAADRQDLQAAADGDPTSQPTSLTAVAGPITTTAAPRRRM